MSMERVEYLRRHPWQVLFGILILFCICAFFSAMSIGRVILVNVDAGTASGQVFSIDPSRSMMRTHRYVYKVGDISFKGSTSTFGSDSSRLGATIKVLYNRRAPEISLPEGEVVPVLMFGLFLLGISILLIAYVVKRTLELK